MDESPSLFNLPLHQIKWAALDIESTGVSAGYDRIIEIALVHFSIKPDGTLLPGERFSSLVNPHRALPKEIETMTGIDDDALRSAPDLKEVWPKILAMTDHRVVMAHHISSDLGWLSREAYEMGLSPLTADFLCTLKLARRRLHGRESYTLPFLIETLALHDARKAPTFHRALPDAMHTRNLFHHCMKPAFHGQGPKLSKDVFLSWPDPLQFQVEVPERLQGLEAYLHASRPCLIIYKGGSKGKQPRPITPLSFYAEKRSPYLRALCHLSKEPRSFRCDRIVRWLPFPEDVP